MDTARTLKGPWKGRNTREERGRYQPTRAREELGPGGGATVVGAFLYPSARSQVPSSWSVCIRLSLHLSVYVCASDPVSVCRSELSVSGPCLSTIGSVPRDCAAAFQ